MKNTLLFTTFITGFLALAYLAALLLSRTLFRWGFFINAKWLFYTAIFGGFLALAWLWILPWSGFLLRWTANRPEISLSRSIAQYQPTRETFVVKAKTGYRAVFAVELPLLELAELGRKTHRALRTLLGDHQASFSALLFEDPTPAHAYKIDARAEGQLQRLFELENQRLAGLSARGPVRFQIVVEVPTLEAARSLKNIGLGFQPIPWTEVAAGFFPPGLWEQPGAVTHCRTRSRGVPAVLETGSGRYLPILITNYRADYQHEANHCRWQQLGNALKRPILWHTLGFPFTAGELFRVTAVSGWESAFPKGLLPTQVRQRLAETPRELQTLKDQLKTGSRKPRLLKQILWIRLADEDDPRTLTELAKQILWDCQLQGRAVTPNLALRYFAALHPGLERFATDAIQGLGLGGEAEEISRELEPLAHWTGHAHANLILETPAGAQTLAFDLFSPEGNNYNLIITGESGSGKSNLAAGLVASHLARSLENTALLVDYGGSFTGPVEAWDGFQISYQDLGKLQISPLPKLPAILDEAAFSQQFPGGDYQGYARDLTALRLSLKQQAFFFIKDCLCGVNVPATHVLKDVFFQFLDETEDAGDNLQARIAVGLAFAQSGRDEAATALKREAFQSLETLLQELEAVTRINPLIGDTAVHFDISGRRLVSFNLDGFQEDEKQILVGLISLWIQQTFAQPRAGMTLFLFDEFHKFKDLAPMLDEVMRVTRKFGASLVLASQSPGDYDAWPSLVENANHHMVMRLKANKALGPEWKLKHPDLIQRARTAPPASHQEGSAVHLGTTIAGGDIEAAFRFRYPVEWGYLFTSREKEKNLLRLACHLTGLPDFLALAEAVHRDRSQPVPVGSAAFFAQLRPRILPRYQPVADHLPALFRDLEASPFLALFLQARERHRFEAIATDPREMEAFLEEGSP